MLARLHHQLGNPEEAKDVLQAHLHDYPTAVDLTHINILAELYMEASEWGLAVNNIQYADAQLCGQAGLPVELQVRLPLLGGACCTQHADARQPACFPVVPFLYAPCLAHTWLHLCGTCRQQKTAEQSDHAGFAQPS